MKFQPPRNRNRPGRQLGYCVTAQNDRYRRLVAAVVLQALEDHTRTIKAEGAARAMRQEPFQWLTSPKSHLFSYVWCCQVLDLSPDRLEAKLLDPNLVSAARSLLSTRISRGDDDE